MEAQKENSTIQTAQELFEQTSENQQTTEQNQNKYRTESEDESDIFKDTKEALAQR